MTITHEERHRILEDSAALLEKYYTKEAAAELRRARADEPEPQGGDDEALFNEMSEAWGNATGGLRKVVEIIDAAKIDGFDGSKRGRDEAVKVLKQVREAAVAALEDEDDEQDATQDSRASDQNGHNSTRG